MIKPVSKPVLWLGDMRRIDEALRFIQRGKKPIEVYEYEQTRQKILEFRQLGINCLGEQNFD